MFMCFMGTLLAAINACFMDNRRIQSIWIPREFFMHNMQIIFKTNYFFYGYKIVAILNTNIPSILNKHINVQWKYLRTDNNVCMKLCGKHLSDEIMDVIEIVFSICFYLFIDRIFTCHILFLSEPQVLM